MWVYIPRTGEWRQDDPWDLLAYLASFRQTRGPMLENEVDSSRMTLKLTPGLTRKHVHMHLHTKVYSLAFKENREPARVGTLPLSQELV